MGRLVTAINPSRSGGHRGIHAAAAGGPIGIAATAVGTRAATVAPPAASTPAPPAEPYVTPLVRQLAAQHGVALTSVQATGKGGRIRRDDVLAAAGAATASARPAPQQPVDRAAAVRASAAYQAVPGWAASKPAASRQEPNTLDSVRETPAYKNWSM